MACFYFFNPLSFNRIFQCFPFHKLRHGEEVSLFRRNADIIRYKGTCNQILEVLIRRNTQTLHCIPFNHLCYIQSTTHFVLGFVYIPIGAIFYSFQKF